MVRLHAVVGRIVARLEEKGCDSQLTPRELVVRVIAGNAASSALALKGKQGERGAGINRREFDGCDADARKSDGLAGAPASQAAGNKPPHGPGRHPI